MHQLIQIPFQNFFSFLCTNPNTYLASKFFQFFMHQPQHLPCFKIFFCILCTNRSPSPVDLQFQRDQRGSAPRSQTHNTNPHTHHLTPADTFPCSHSPLCLTVLPTVQLYHCTTAPPHRTQASQSYHRTTVPPYHRTFLRPCRHTTANTTCHTPMIS